MSFTPNPHVKRHYVPVRRPYSEGDCTECPNKHGTPCPPAEGRPLLAFLFCDRNLKSKSERSRQLTSGAHRGIIAEFNT